jgi:hypothetical protein
VDRRPDLLPAGAAGRFEGWLAAARAGEAAAARSREGFLRRTGPEDATFAGILVDLAERGGPVVVEAVGDRRHRGTLQAVGADFAALRTPDGRHVLLAERGIASITAEGRAPEAVGDRDVQVVAGLAEALAALAEDRPRVLVVTVPGTGLAGDLVAVGRDVVTLRLDGADRRTAYVALAAIAEVSTA